MVAPHQVGDLVRSFVRVTGSGSGKRTRPEFCDLGQVSAWAASVSIPQNLPPVPNVRTQSLTPPPTANTHQRKRPRPDDEKTDCKAAPKVKVAHMEVPSTATATPVKKCWGSKIKRRK